MLKVKCYTRSVQEVGISCHDELFGIISYIVTGYTGHRSHCLHLFKFVHHASSKVSLNCVHEKMQNYTCCIYWIFSVMFFQVRPQMVNLEFKSWLALLQGFSPINPLPIQLHGIDPVIPSLLYLEDA